MSHFHGDCDCDYCLDYIETYKEWKNHSRRRRRHDASCDCDSCIATQYYFEECQKALIRKSLYAEIELINNYYPMDLNKIKSYLTMIDDYETLSDLFYNKSLHQIITECFV